MMCDSAAAIYGNGADLAVSIDHRMRAGIAST
jgi:hypothetical protein